MSSIMHIVPISGGKDSQATALWVANNKSIESFYLVHNQTGWENPLTNEFLQYLEKQFSEKIIFASSRKFNGMIDLAKKKKRFPSSKAKFCTIILKVEPMIDYILKQNSDIIIYQGIRADESANRSKMKANDEFFKNYLEPRKFDKKGKAIFDTYRKKEVLEYCNTYSVDVYRPIFNWSANDVFDYIKDNKQKHNPLYNLGFSRVGCFPCVQCRHSEIELINEHFPERIKEISKYEIELNSTFFTPNFIPGYACKKTVITKNNKVKKIATINDVVNYVTKGGRKGMFPTPSCQSIYNICE